MAQYMFLLFDSEEWYDNVTPEEWQLVAGELSRLFQLRSCSQSGASFAASTGAFPLEIDSLRDKSFDGIGHVREPGSAPHFAIGHDLDSDLPLALQSLGDGLVFRFP